MILLSNMLKIKMYITYNNKIVKNNTIFKKFFNLMNLIIIIK